MSRGSCTSELSLLDEDGPSKRVNKELNPFQEALHLQEESWKCAAKKRRQVATKCP